MGRSDDMTHIGEYLQLTNSGHFANWNIYPASHIIGATISVVSNLDANYTSFIVPIVFSFLFIMGIYIFTKQLFNDSFIKAISTASSFILYLGIYNFLNVPHALFFSFVPLYLFVIYSYTDNKKENTLSFSVVFVLMTLLIPYTHPFIAYFAIMLFLLHIISYNFFVQKNKKIQIPKLKFTALLLLLTSYLSWYVYQGRLVRELIILFNAYINQIGRDPTTQWALEKLNKVHFGFFDYLQLISFFYGRYAFPTIFIVLGIISLCYNRDILYKKSFRSFLYLFVLYLFFLLIECILIFNPVVAHHPDRMMNLNFIIYGQIPLFSFSLYILFFNRSKSVYRTLFVCLILSSIWTFSFFGCLDSPYVYRTNVALTYNEVEGMRWFYDVKDDNAIIGVPYSQVSRFRDLFDERDMKDNMRHFPDHFGYSSSPHNIQQINFELREHFYVVVLTIDELLYQEVPGYAEVGRYNKSDFLKLRNDISINKIYDSMNIEIFGSKVCS